MDIITKSELKEILDLHQKWLNHEEGGKRADLMNMDLRGVDFSYTNLSHAYFSASDLSCASFRGADLRSASLRGAILHGADLEGTNLSFANLTEANLTGANLYAADLHSANLYNADLLGANLYAADFKHACIDYICLPISDQLSEAGFDDDQTKLMMYYIIRACLRSRNVSPESKKELNKLVNFANGFHQVDKYGAIKPWEEEK